METMEKRVTGVPIAGMSVMLFMAALLKSGFSEFLQ
jgi:hypothetical protein